MNLFLRFLLPIIFLLATFWPDYGLAWIAWGFFPSYPYVVGLVSAVWAVIFSLLLPLPVKLFRNISTVLILAAIAVSTVLVRSAGLLPEVSTQFGIIYLILVAGFVMGWWLIATRLWRGIHSIVAVEDQHA